MTLFAGDNSGIQSKFLTVNAAVPKFDIASKHETFRHAEITGDYTNAFSPETADFSLRFPMAILFCPPFSTQPE